LLQAYLGHKNIHHTVRYTELSPEAVALHKYPDHKEVILSRNQLQEIRAEMLDTVFTVHRFLDGLYGSHKNAPADHPLLEAILPGYWEPQGDAVA
jgi:hypothetical protein